MLVLGSVPAMWYIVFEGFLLSRRVSHAPENLTAFETNKDGDVEAHRIHGTGIFTDI